LLLARINTVIRQWKGPWITHTPHKVDEDKPAGVHKYNQMFNTILQTMLVGIFDDTVAVDRQLAETQADKLQVTVTE